MAQLLILAVAGSQLLREHRVASGEMTNAIERLQEALDSEPNNAPYFAELAKT